MWTCYDTTSSVQLILTLKVIIILCVTDWYCGLSPHLPVPITCRHHMTSHAHHMPITCRHHMPPAITATTSTIHDITWHHRYLPRVCRSSEQFQNSRRKWEADNENATGFHECHDNTTGEACNLHLSLHCNHSV